MIFMMIAHQQFVFKLFFVKMTKKRVVGWEQDIITKNADKDDAFDANDADAFASITFGDSLIGRFKGPCTSTCCHYWSLERILLLLPVLKL